MTRKKKPSSNDRKNRFEQFLIANFILETLDALADDEREYMNDGAAASESQTGELTRLKH